MTPIATLKAWFDTLNDFRTFRKQMKSHFNRPPSLREFVDREFDAEEASAQRAYEREVAKKVDLKYGAVDAMLTDFLFPTEVAVRKFLAYQGCNPVEKIDSWIVSYSQKFVAMGLHIVFSSDRALEEWPKSDYLLFGPISAFPDMVQKATDPDVEKLKKAADEFVAGHQSQEG